MTKCGTVLGSGTLMKSVASDTLKVGADWKYSFGGLKLTP